MDVSKADLWSLLSDIINYSGAHRINVLAHSMGNQILTKALEDAGRELGMNASPVLDQVIMAAPDVDVDALDAASEKILRTARHVTIYSCRKDLPVRMSEWIHGNQARVGSFALIKGFDTIDASLIQMNGLLNHSYIADTEIILRDIKKLIEYGCAVNSRCSGCLEKRTDKPQTYWAFQPSISLNCTHLDPCPTDSLK